MSYYRAGDVIRLTRIANGISQEELSDGICSVQTLHRIENGKTGVKKELYSLLMSKMEHMPEKNYAVCVGKDMELLEERALYEAAMNTFQYEKAEEYLDSLKTKADKNIVTKQYIAKAEALIAYYKHEISEEQLIIKLQEAIQLTLPEYQEKQEKDYPFTEQEIMILMSTANAYLHWDKFDRAIDIYDILLNCLKRKYISGTYVGHMKILFLRNKAVAYANKKQYEKSLEIYKIALNIAQRSNNGKVIAILYSDIACAYFRLAEKCNKPEAYICEAQKNLQLAYYVTAARGDEAIKNVVLKAYKMEHLIG